MAVTHWSFETKSGQMWTGCGRNATNVESANSITRNTTCSLCKKSIYYRREDRSQR